MQQINRIKFNNMATILRLMAVLILWTLMVGQVQAFNNSPSVSGNGLVIKSQQHPASVANGTDFGSTQIGTTTAEHTFVLRNIRGVDLVVNSLTFGGANTNDFTVTQQPVSPVPAGGQTEFKISYTPSVPFNGSILYIKSNSEEGVYMFSLRGHGTPIPVPHMVVIGDQHNIDNGDKTPSLSEHTDFGGLLTNGPSYIERTFTISNSGTADLNLTGSPTVEIHGAALSEFTVTQQPQSLLAQNTQTEFIIRFQPSATGLRHATVSIANDDSPRNPYTFAIQGNGGLPPIMRANGGFPGLDWIINNNSTSVNATVNTDFGSAIIGSDSVEKIFSISNVGVADLNLTGTPKVDITGAAAGDFTVSQQPDSPIPAGGGPKFKILFQPSATGERHAIVSIANDDPDADPYTFAIQGIGTPHPGPYMVVSGNQHNISSLDFSPSTADNTDFGGVVNDGSQSRELTFTIRNSGTADLHLITAPPLDIVGRDFTVTAQPPSLVRPNEQFEFKIRFQPSATGLRHATVAIFNNTQSAIYTFSIQGNGTPQPVPHMVVSGDRHNIVNGDPTPAIADHTDFGGAISTSGSVVKTFQIDNGGTADLNLTGTSKVDISGAAAGDFSVTVEPASSLGPNHQTLFFIQFAPSVDGLRHATVSIANDDPDANPYTFAIQGTGTPAPKPHMVVSGDRHNIVNGDTTPDTSDNTDFGDAVDGSGSVEKTFQIDNGGTADLNLTGATKVDITGATPGDFSVTLEPASSLGPNHQAVFSIRFAPSAVGLRTAMVSIANDDPEANPYTFTIQGTSTPAPKPHMVVSGSGHPIVNGDDTPTFSDNTDFGSRQSGRESIEKIFQIDNGGTADLNLIGTPKVAISGDAAGDFTVTTEPGSPLGTTQQTAFRIRFAPSALGLRTATITIANDDPDANPYTFAIQGTGMRDETPYYQIRLFGHDHTNPVQTDVWIKTGGDPLGGRQISVSRGNVFGSAPIGTSIEHTFTISNTGKAAVTISNVTFAGDYYTGALPDQWKVTQMPLSPLPVGAETEFKITFTPKRLNDPVTLREEVEVQVVSSDRYTVRRFHVNGIATPQLQPHMVVSGSGSVNDIHSGDHTPETGDNTDFGSVLTDGSEFHDLSFTISNSNAGEADLNLTGAPLVEILGAAASDFTVTQPVSSTLAPNTQSEFTIRFDPSVDGLRHATVSIANNDPRVAPYTFAIQGNGAPGPSPHMQMFADSGWMLNNKHAEPNPTMGTDFGSTSIASSGVEMRFTIQNKHHEVKDNVISTSDLNLTGSPPVEILGAARSDFTVTQQPADTTLVVGAAETPIKILFQPSAIGLRHAMVSIANDDSPRNPYTFAIQGTGTPESKPHMVVLGDDNNINNGDPTPATADNTDFGGAISGSGSVVKEFKIANSGTADLNLTGVLAVAITGAAADDFSVATNPHSPVAPHTHTVFDIVFKPSIDGLRHATVSITNDDTAHPYTFVIQGRGTPEPKPHIVLSGDQQDIINLDKTPSTADDTDFGSTTIGGVSVDHTFQIRNSGTADLNLTGTPNIVVIDGAAKGDFSVITPPATTIGSSLTSPIAIRFTPTREGLRAATVSITNDDTAHPYTFAIVGTGTPQPKPHLVVSGHQQNIANLDTSPSTADDTDFGTTIIHGVSVDRTFQIRNSGTADLNLAAGKVIISGAKGMFTVITQPVTTIGPGQTGSMIIRFTPTEVGLQHANVAIANNDADRGIFIFGIQGIGELNSIPKIVVVGGQHNINNRDVTPATADNTDFGSVVNDGSQYHDRSFTIKNNGGVDLNLTGTPIVAISGHAAGDFSVTTLPATTIGSRHTSPIVIRFKPSIDGPRHALVSITNNDTTNPYTFAIQGWGTAVPQPQIVVAGDKHNIDNGDATPSTADKTDFGTTTIGSVGVDHTFQINNSGTADLNLNGTPNIVAISGAASEFTVITQPAATIGRAQASPLTIRFTPTEEGVRRATVIILNNDADRGVLTFSIQGIGKALPKPQMVVLGNGQHIDNGNHTPALADNTDFGSAISGSGSVEKTFQINNSGTASLRLGGWPTVAISGDAAGDFTVSLEPSPLIDSNHQAVFKIHFAPSTVGERTATVSIANDDSDANPYTFAIKGAGTKKPEPQMVVVGNGQNINNGDPTPAIADDTDFGGAISSSGSVEKTFQIDNSGTAELNLTGTTTKVAISGDAAGDFSVTVDPGSPLGLNHQAVFKIRFAPSVDGLRTATVSIANNDPDANPYTFAIKGIGTAQLKPHMVVSGNGHNIDNGDDTPVTADNTDFGGALSAYSSVDKTFKIDNSGTADLNLTGTTTKVAISGDAAGDFSVTVEPDSPLGPKHQAVFTIRFAPSVDGLRTATVSIANDDPDANPYTFDIKGAGTPQPKPHMVVLGNQHNIDNGDPTPAIANNTDFGGAIRAQGSIEKTFQIVNGGSADLILTGSTKVAISGDAARDFTVTAEPSSPLEPSHHAVFTIRFAPSTIGERTATVSIANDDSDANPYTFAIKGAGTKNPEPHMVVSGSQNNIVNGDDTPDISDNTDFGDAASAGVEKTFQINNGGTADLNLTGTPKVAISGAAAGDFSVTVEPGSPLGPNHQAVFSIRFAPSGRDLRTAMVSIANNDPDVDPYTFAIQGTGIVYTVNVNVVGAGNVLSEPKGIDCGTACEEQFLSSEVILSAYADSDADSEWSLESWGADCAGSAGTTCNLSMDSDKSATATFTCVHLSIPAQPSIVTKEEYECFDIEVNKALEILTEDGDVTFHAENSISIGPGFRVGNEAKLKVNTGL